MATKKAQLEIVLGTVRSVAREQGFNITGLDAKAAHRLLDDYCRVEGRTRGTEASNWYDQATQADLDKFYRAWKKSR